MSPANNTRKLPSSATVLSLIALLVSLSGTAFALTASSVGSKQVINGSIAAKDVKAETLASKQLKDGAAVSGADVINGSLDGADIAADSLGGAQIDEASLKLSSGGSSGVAGGDLTGSYPTPTVAADAIAGAEVVNGSLSGDDIDEATLAKVGDANTLDGNDSTSFLAASGLAGGDLGGPFSNLQLGAGSVTAAEIATDAVGSSEIATDAVGSGEIATDAVGSDEIATNGVESDEIATDAVGVDEIGSDAVSGPEIADGAVSTAEVFNGSLTTDDFSGLETFTAIDLPLIFGFGCEQVTLTGGIFAGVQVGDIGYIYPVQALETTLVAQTGTRQTTAGEFHYRVCNVNFQNVDDVSRFYGVRLVR